MGDVIKGDFQKTLDGYILNDDGFIDGIYSGELALAKSYNDNLIIGEHLKDGIGNPLFINRESFTDLCIMWLAIEAPERLKEDR